MNLKNLMAINSIIGFLYGIGFLVVPSFVLSIYGGTQGPTEILLAQLYAVCLLIFGVLLWFVRDINNTKVLSTVSLSLLITTFIGAVVAAKATISGGMNAMGWVSVLIYSLLGLGYAYFQFLNPQKSPQS